MKLLLKITLILGFISCVTPIYAQTTKSKGDQLFAEGQLLQQKKQYKKAIAKYQAAKVAYTSVEKKNMCDAQIKLCKPSSKKPADEVVTTVKKSTLTITPKVVELSGDKDGSVGISINSSDSAWYFNIPKGLEGESVFITAERKSNNELIVNAEANKSTLSRRQSLYVKTAELSDTVVINQSGKDVTLRTSDNFLTYKLSGGKKVIEVITNSDSIVGSNNNESWYIESKPEWIEINVLANTEQSKLDKATSKVKNFFKNTAVTYAEDEKSSKINILAIPIIKSDPEYQTGRKGEIIVAAQGKKHKIVIVQQ